MIENEPAFFLLLYELFSAGRRNPDIRHEVGQLFQRTRSHVAEVLKAKEREGVLNLRYDAEAVVSYLFAVGDGFALQALSDPSATTAPRWRPGRRRPDTCSSRTEPALSATRSRGRPRADPNHELGLTRVSLAQRDLLPVASLPVLPAMRCLSTWQP